MREPVHAYCVAATGFIRFDAEVPEGAIPLAVGPRADLQGLVLDLAAMAQDKPALVVPGLAEATSEAARRAAIVRFKERIDAAINERLERELAEVRQHYERFHACFPERPQAAAAAALADDDEIVHPAGSRIDARFVCTLPVSASEREVCDWLERQLALLPWILDAEPLAVRSVPLHALAVSIERAPAPVDLRRLPS